MKNIILAGLMVLSLGLGVANANSAPAPLPQANQYSSSEGGWG